MLTGKQKVFAGRLVSMKPHWHRLLQGKIVEMRAYLDSAMVVRLLGEADRAQAPE